MSATEKKFDNIAGVPTLYMRYDSSHVMKSHTFYCTNDFYSRTVRFVKDLDAYTRPAGYGDITGIVLGGAHTPKSGKHGEGEALDIDRIMWGTDQWCSPIKGVHDHEAAFARRRYLALDAVCRQHFRWVLNGFYNAAHRDHIHVDTGGLPVQLSTRSRSDLVFIQAVCNEFANQNLTIDGRWGNKTSAGLKTALRMAGLGSLSPTTSQSDYRRFMQKVSQKGFRNQTF